MAYSDFTMRELSLKFGIKEQKALLFDIATIIPLTPSEILQSELSDAKLLPDSSEKAKSEAFIFPILKEVWRQCNRSFYFYSGYTFNVSEADKLTGVCDYLFSTEKSIEICSTVFCIVEAKNRGLDEGIAQAFAEMYAAQIFNAQQNKPTPIVYGCVTNAYEWLFLKLDNKQATIDTERYANNSLNLPVLLGMLKHIISSYI
jgi:hypothetical protein